MNDNQNVPASVARQQLAYTCSWRWMLRSHLQPPPKDCSNRGGNKRQWNPTEANEPGAGAHPPFLTCEETWDFPSCTRWGRSLPTPDNLAADCRCQTDWEWHISPGWVTLALLCPCSASGPFKAFGFLKRMFFWDFIVGQPTCICAGCLVGRRLNSRQVFGDFSRCVRNVSEY